MKEVFKKLKKACEEAGYVKKGDRKAGMPFNPLLADDVKQTAMEALLKNNLYPICNYITDIKDNFLIVTCNMNIYDVDNPNEFIEIKGCSGLGKLDKYGTGNGITYAQKYAFLNALNLKTGIKDEDGFEASPFKNNKPVTQLKVVKDNKTLPDTKALADDWIDKMTKQAEHSVSQNSYEKGMQPLRENYAKELQQISIDLMQQARVDEVENTLKKKITNRRK